jgi:hypothetical protein
MSPVDLAGNLRRHTAVQESPAAPEFPPFGCRPLTRQTSSAHHFGVPAVPVTGVRATGVLETGGSRPCREWSQYGESRQPHATHRSVAEALLTSANPARLAYSWMDGSPRVVPIWFHWTGDQFVLGTPAKAPKLKALAANPQVALTIDDNAWPHKVLLVRGRADIELLEDVVPEYALSATRYFGPEQGPAWVATIQGKPMAGIAVTPKWVGIIDFQTRFPSALTV